METLQDWQNKEELAETLIPIIGQLYRKQSIITVLYDIKLVHKSSIEIINSFENVKEHFNVSINMNHVKDILLAVLKTKYKNLLRFDVGKVSLLLKDIKQENYENKLNEYFNNISTDNNLPSSGTDVILYGFGRIGRLIARELINRTGDTRKLLLRAIVVRKPSKPDLKKRANLLIRDSIHGKFNGEVKIDEKENTIIANGVTIHLLYSNEPGIIDFTTYNINNALLIDNTGKWRTREALSKHLNSKGISKIILTAPGQKDVPNIVNGVNNYMLDKDENIYSTASCTTNAIVPVLSIIDSKYGISSGHIETVHSFTNDQNLTDNYHPSSRRGRSAALNMVLTNTGAGTAVGKCIPSLNGKLTANAIRVPTPNVSLAILSLYLSTETTLEEFNNYLKKSAIESHLHQQIDYSTSDEAVSCDFVGNPHCSIIDAPSTIVANELGKSRVNLYVWYDNEFGYSMQVIRFCQKIGNITHINFP